MTAVTDLAGKLRGQPAFERAVEAAMAADDARAEARRCALKLERHSGLTENERESLHNAVSCEAAERRLSELRSRWQR